VCALEREFPRHSGQPSIRPSIVVSRRAAVLAIFVLSGAAGLIYEVVWARQLVLVFGNTTQAVSAILTGFFGGMAIGSWVGGRVADRIRSPLRMYGVIEVALVAIVLATPILFRLLHEVYRGAFGALEEAPQLLALVRFGLALVALGPATVLMGATLPALTRHLSRSGIGLSGAFGGLYAANTFGAVAGTTVAGLVLIELLGLTGALVVGALCSLVAGLVAIVLARSWPAGDPGLARDPATDRGRSSAGAAEAGTATLPGIVPRPNLALVVAFVSGLTSLGYQVLWTRLLASGTGNSTYVFTMILAVFLTGIAIGAVIFSIVRPRIRRPVLVLAGAQLAVALLALLGLVLVIGRPPGMDPSQAIATLGLLWGTVIPVVLPATIVMGLAFPAASALLDPREDRVATSAGTLLATNTLGAITGTFVVPFLVIPLIGSPTAIVGLALVNAVTALLLGLGAIRERLPRLVTTGASVAVVVVLVASLALPGRTLDPTVHRIEANGGQLLAAAEDEIAAVHVGTIRDIPQLWVTGTAMTLLTADARMMAILPLIARPDATSALTVAFGMGSTYRSALIAGLETDAVELVPSVPAMFGWFFPDADEMLNAPDGRVIVADGRNYLELTDRTYDLIITDPPPPIESAGASVISSREYYEAGRRRLNPGGLMMQWMPWGSDMPEFRAHIRTFHDVFPEVLVAFGPVGYGLFMLGSEDPVELDDAAIREVLGRPGVLEDLSSAFDSPHRTAGAWAARIPQLVFLSGPEVAEFAGEGPLITDDRPIPEYFLLRRSLGAAEPRVGPAMLQDWRTGVQDQ
jgi:spermidine synthase